MSSRPKTKTELGTLSSRNADGALMYPHTYAFHYIWFNGVWLLTHMVPLP